MFYIINILTICSSNLQQCMGPSDNLYEIREILNEERVMFGACCVEKCLMDDLLGFKHRELVDEKEMGKFLIPKSHFKGQTS